MSADPLLGEIMPVGFNFAPRGWSLCNGQLIAIASNTALFSLLGCTYGGDCRTTMALPDLRSRSPVGVGTGAGLDTISWGERGGSYYTIVTTAHMPSHNHTAELHGENALATDANPSGRMLAGHLAYADNNGVAGDNKIMDRGSIVVGNTGGTQPMNIRNPFLGIYYCIAMQGVFPSRS